MGCCANDDDDDTYLVNGLPFVQEHFINQHKISLEYAI